MSDLSIWEYIEPDHGRALFTRIAGIEDQAQLNEAFGAHHAGSGAVEAAEASAEQSMANAKASIEALDLPDDMKAGLLAGLDEIEDDEDDEDGADDEDGEFELLLPSSTGLALTASHMFFADPYASIDCEEIDRQTHDAMKGFRAAFDAAIGAPGAGYGKTFGVDELALYQNEDFLFESPAGYEIGEQPVFWQTSHGTWFLAFTQEDKELPIFISFGRFLPEDHTKLSAHLRGFVD